MDQLRCRVKAAAVANLTDARYFAALGVDYLGFALEPSSTGYLGEAAVAAVREWVEGPQFVGECGGMPTPEIVRLAESLSLHAVQVGPFGKTTEVARATGLPVLQLIPMGNDFDPAAAQVVLERNAADVQFFVLDLAAEGLSWPELSARPGWKDWLAASCANFPVLLDIPVPPESLLDMLIALELQGLQVRGGEEEAVGVKSYEELDDLFDVLRVEE